ncbi:hypothetical protein SeLEV6574_g05082 [Synchytrium endobioticum]|uniref:Uncharacterized protein n=1 Tax=Synchytrium endobioticum TaxID=286115 RepID=A0A507CW62_9FUNG|nr:hypothetical protein SeLEV6574_g05082 [Synchytrium endobioticum]
MRGARLTLHPITEVTNKMDAAYLKENVATPLSESLSSLYIHYGNVPSSIDPIEFVGRYLLDYVSSHSRLKQDRLVAAEISQYKAEYGKSVQTIAANRRRLSLHLAERLPVLRDIRDKKLVEDEERRAAEEKLLEEKEEAARKAADESKAAAEAADASGDGAIKEEEGEDQQ